MNTLTTGTDAGRAFAIGPHLVAGGVVLAPMAGVTDAPFRSLCRAFGAGLTVGEMASSSAHLAASEMTRRRMTGDADDPLAAVQLLGADPAQMARAATAAVALGAKIVDINFGCPARVVCGKACGSALMREPALAGEIMRAVAHALEGTGVPMTVKMRTGWDETSKNAVGLALLAEQAGAAAVTVHGRTRAQRFTGGVNRADIAAVVRAVSIPVIANGDIDSPAAALAMIRETGAAGIMIGRAARGNPWLIARARAVLAGRDDPGEPDARERLAVVRRHLAQHMAYWMAQGREERHAAASFRAHLRAYLQPVLAQAARDGCGEQRLERAAQILARLLRDETQAAAGEDLEQFFCALGRTN